MKIENAAEKKEVLPIIETKIKQIRKDTKNKWKKTEKL